MNEEYELERDDGWMDSGSGGLGQVEGAEEGAAGVKMSSSPGKEKRPAPMSPTHSKSIVCI